MKLTRTLCLSLCILAMPALTWATPVVANGSFEADAFSFGGTLSLGCGNTLTAWSTQCSPDNVYPWGLPNANVYSAGPTPYGDQWVIVGDFGAGGSSIYQTIGGFNIGEQYSLDFALASELPGAGALVFASVIGVGTTSQTFAAPLRGPNYWDTWGNFSLSFVADSSSETIRFDGLAGPGFDAGIDNVQIASTAAVPEPASLMLLGTGLLAAGWARRRLTGRS